MLNKHNNNLAISNKAKYFGILINILEWYDYALFVYLAPIISSLYFPNHDKLISLINVYALFAIGFIARPVGSVIFGYIGDYYSRKKAVFWSLITMSIPTLFMIFLPTYEIWGSYSSLYLLILRILQGIAVGGNYGGSSVFAIEYAPENKRGLAGSLTEVGTFVGFLLGSLLCTALTNLLSETQLYSWGWRIPFAFGIFSLIAAFCLDYSFPDITLAKKNVRINAKNTLKMLLALLINAKIIKAIFIITLDTVGIYLLFFFYKQYLEILGYNMKITYIIHTIGIILMITMTIFFGFLSDKIGRKPILISVSLGFIIIPYWGFNLVQKINYLNAMIIQIIFSIIMAACYGALPAFIVEMFPGNIRYTASSLAFNICASIFGGTALMFALYLLKYTNNVNSVAIYLALIAIGALISLYYSKDHYQQALT